MKNLNSFKAFELSKAQMNAVNARLYILMNMVEVMYVPLNQK